MKLSGISDSMIFDITLPATLFTVTLATIFTFEKYEEKFQILLKEKTLTVRDVVLLVIVMGSMVTLMVFVPQMAFVVLFLFAYSLLMFTFTYIIAPKWYIAVVPSAIFLTFYLLFSGIIGLDENTVWELVLMNIYAAVFAVMITTYVGSMFTWKTTLVFAVLLTVMDIIQVLYTGHMIEAVQRIVGLKLPMLIKVPTLPPIIRGGNWMFSALGVGDFFFAGLLATQTLRRFGKKQAITATVALTLSFFIFETLMFNNGLEAFPGTLMIILGWAIVNGFEELLKAKR
jgi:presenilin-like A22 family membrane protease